jgi:hypothetical protein
MQHRLKTLSLIIITIVGFSCQNDDSEVPPMQVDHRAIAQFIAVVDKSVETLRNHPPEDDTQATHILIESVPEIQATLGIDLSMARDTRTAPSGREPLAGTSQKSAARTQFEQKIVSSSQASTSADDYLRRLALLQSEIRNSRSVSGMEKSELLTLVALNEEFVRYLDQQVREIARSGGQVAPAMKCSGWWSCWGRCVAGTVGGAGLGALTGAAYGGAGCTMVLPVVGTVACGTVGAIAGGVFGGLAGAATSC